MCSRSGTSNQCHHFKHDGAPARKSKLVKRFLEDIEIQIWEWPDNSVLFSHFYPMKILLAATVLIVTIQMLYIIILYSEALL